MTPIVWEVAGCLARKGQRPWTLALPALLGSPGRWGGAEAGVSPKHSAACRTPLQIANHGLETTQGQLTLALIRGCGVISRNLTRTFEGEIVFVYEGELIFTAHIFFTPLQSLGRAEGGRTSTVLNCGSSPGNALESS